MKLKKRSYFFGLSLLALLIITAHVLPRKKPGFSPQKIRSPLEKSSMWKVMRPTPTEELFIREILSQDFNYLGAGAQCYAFISADGKYVLKFFRMKHLLPKQWLKYLPLPGLSEYRYRKVEKRMNRQKALFSSYKMAYEELRAETGIVFVHLNKSKNLKLSLNLYDRMRKRYTINLDKYEFVLQKKAQLVRDRIASQMQKGEQEEAIESIHDLLQQVVNQCKKGFIDKDSGISHNYGFAEGKVIHFDVGRIAKDESAKDPAFYQREVLRVGKKVKLWLEIHYPTLLPALEDEINSLIDL